MKTADVARKVAGRYIKPQVPDGPFMLVDPAGIDDGPFLPEQLAQSELKGKPWYFPSVSGRPVVLYANKQTGLKLDTDQGTFTFRPLTETQIQELRKARMLP